MDLGRSVTIYDVAAWFDRPINGRTRACTRDDRQEMVDAETPEAAARKWLWRLSEVERRFTVRLVVFAPRPRPVIPVYAGPPVRFRREGGQLAAIEADPQSSGDQVGDPPLRSQS